MAPPPTEKTVAHRTIHILVTRCVALSQPSLRCYSRVVFLNEVIDRKSYRQTKQWNQNNINNTTIVACPSSEIYCWIMRFYFTFWQSSVHYRAISLNKIKNIYIDRTMSLFTCRKNYVTHSFNEIKWIFHFDIAKLTRQPLYAVSVSLSCHHKQFAMSLSYFIPGWQGSNPIIQRFVEIMLEIKANKKKTN